MAWFLLLIAAIACGGPGPTPTPTLPPTPTPFPPLLLPADEAPHQALVEWWYYNMHLWAGTGERYAVHYVVFQLREPLNGIGVYIAHAGLADAQSDDYVTAERVSPPQLLRQTVGPEFEIRLGDWSLEGLGDRYLLEAADADEGWALDLELTSSSKTLLHDGDALVDFHTAGVSYYYSRPRLPVSGALTINGVTQAVTGLAWMDKQWGDFNPVSIGWDWASIQLESGTDIMLTRAIDPGGGPLQTYGTLGRPDGVVEHLDGEAFTFQPISERSWFSPETALVYPLSWRVEVPSKELDLTLTAMVPESEYVSEALGVTYWEGGILVSGDERGVPVQGQGFVEITRP